MLSSKRILVIDDEPRMQSSLKSLLMPWGYCVYTADGSQEGIRLLQEHEIHVVVTDIRMGNGSGYEVMAWVQENCPGTQVIAITGHASTESAIEAMHHAIFDYITKPFEFDALRKSIERAFEKVEANRLREDLISMITHDIKVPLTSIIGYASLITDKRSSELHPKTRDFVDIIQVSAQRILSLVDNFLTTTKFDAGKLIVPPNPVKLNLIFIDLEEALRVQLEKAQLRLRIDLDHDLPAVRGEENLLYRAMSNLLSNALQYSNAGGWIEVRGRRLDAGDSPLGLPTVRVEIANSGKGIETEMQQAIFERYERAGQEGGSRKGTGLGLFAVKCICDAHEAHVQVQSIPNESTTFSVFLPVHGEAAAPAGY